MKITNPLTGNSDIIKIFSIPSKRIIKLYEEEMGIHVDSYFEGIDNIELFECSQTHYRFFFPNITGNEEFYNQLKIQLPKLYNAPYYSEWKWEYEIVLKYINESHKVLEIGCGSGFFLERLHKKGIDAYGIELNEASVLEAKQKGLNVNLFTIEDYSKTANKYDIICSFQVLEHVFEVRSFIEACLKILNKNGLLIFAVPNNEPFLFRNDIYNTLNLPPHHVGYWNKKSFKGLQDLFNLKLKSLIIEKLPDSGYDFERYYITNKPGLSQNKSIAQRLTNTFYRIFLKLFHSFINGKNIVAIYEKL